MLKIEYLQELLVVSIALSIFTCTFIQKTKRHLPTQKLIPIYSLIVNLSIGIVFCMSFTGIIFFSRSRYTIQNIRRKTSIIWWNIE